MKKFLVSTNGHEFVMVEGDTMKDVIRSYAERDNVMNGDLYEDSGRKIHIVEFDDVYTYSVARVDMPTFQVAYMGRGK